MNSKCFVVKKSVALFFAGMLVVSSSCLSMHIEEIRSLKSITTKGVFKERGNLLLLDLDENILIEDIHTPYKDKILHGKEYRLIESDISETIRTKKNYTGKDSDVVVLGLTKRSATINKAKRKGQMDQGHVILKNENIDVSRRRFSKYDNSILCGNKNAVFVSGVIYTANGDKAIYLDDFLKLSGFKPNYIAMSDDKKENLESVLKYAKSKNIPMNAYLMRGVEDLK